MPNNARKNLLCFKIGWIASNSQDPNVTDQRLESVNYIGEDPSRGEETRILLQAAIESANDAIIITELNLDHPGPRIEYVNPAFARMTGYSESEAIGQSPRMLQGPKTSRALLDRLRRDLENSDSFHGETVNYRKDGSEYVVEWRITPVKDNSGRPIKWLAVQRDVTERVRAEESLKDLNHGLQQFVYSASHDLQEPIRNIVIQSQLIERKGESLPDDVQRHFAFMREGAKRVGDLVTDLLQYTRLIAVEQRGGHVDLVDTDQIVQTVLSDLSVAIGQADAVIEVDPLPKINILSIHLTAVMQNLINNAIKYRDSARQLKIHIGSTKQSSDVVVLSVKDNGIGIAPEYHDEIFGVFRRLHDRNIPGTGIGLAITQRIIEKYGQRIWVESEPGVGSTFSFTAPAQSTHEHHHSHRR